MHNILSIFVQEKVIKGQKMITPRITNKKSNEKKNDFLANLSITGHNL